MDEADLQAFRNARMALAVVIEVLPYGCDLAHESQTLIQRLRTHEYEAPLVFCERHSS